MDGNVTWEFQTVANIFVVLPGDISRHILNIKLFLGPKTFLSWNFFVESHELSNLKIFQSDNLTYLHTKSLNVIKSQNNSQNLRFEVLIDILRMLLVSIIPQSSESSKISNGKGNCNEITKFLPAAVGICGDVKNEIISRWTTDVAFLLVSQIPISLASRAVHFVEFWWIYVWMWDKIELCFTFLFSLCVSFFLLHVQGERTYLRPVLNGIKSIFIQLTSFPNWFLVDCSINIQLFPIFTSNGCEALSTHTTWDQQ